jgi:hypothetical protein
MVLEQRGAQIKSEFSVLDPDRLLSILRTKVTSYPDVIVHDALPLM